MERVNICWTGGFDSTFRICQLSMLNIEIQPYYIDMGRKSMKHELKAISTISDHIYKRESTKCRLLPLIIVRNNQILPNSRITNSFNYLSKKVEIGTQHDWLARFADQMKIKLELGFEYDPDEESINRYLEKNAKSKEVSITLENGKLEYIEFDDSQTSADITNVFGAFRFGLPLRKMTKLETMDAYIKMGFEEVISMTWFCAHPVIGIPCGLCTPCETVMKADMSFRLPGISRILYKFFKTNSFGKCLNYSLKKYYNKYFRKT